MSTAFLTQVAEDIDTMLADFGQTVTVGGVSITAIFDNEYAVIDGVGIASAAPALHCKSTDVSTAMKGTAAVVGGVNCTVSEPPKPDGTGMTILILRKS